jgi:hypothetical protein
MQRLQRRCEFACLSGVASVTGYRLAFCKKSKDGSGKATLIADLAGQAFGAIFDIVAKDAAKLDQIEGRGKGYERIEELTALSYPDGKPIAVTTNIADDGFRDSALQPYDWYLDLVLKGAEQHHLPDEYVERLRAIPALTDPDPNRRTRLEALVILDGTDKMR